MADRRRSLWVDTIFNITVGNNAEVLQDLMGSLLENETRLSQLTLVRTIIGVDIAYTVHDAGEGSQQAGLGISAVSRETFAAGVTAMAQPNVEADFPALPWIMRARYRIFGFAADQPAVFVRRVDLDIRAQRKLANAMIVMVVTNNPSEGVATTLNFSGMVRCLFLV